MRNKKFLYTLFSVLLVATGASSTGAAPQPEEIYIIKFVDNANLDNEIAALQANGVGVEREYRNVFKGAAVRMNAARAEALTKNPRVDILEKDGVVTNQATVLPTLSWGLDRVDQKTPVNLNIAGSYTYAKDGTGINAYILDTGISPTHSEFITPELTTRVSAIGYSAFGDASYGDCNGHGTHVAGTVGGSNVGLAVKVNLIPVKVLDCNGSGSWSGVIAGLDWIRSANDTNTRKPSVANMSLGGGKSSIVNMAVARLVARGVTVVVAAGNDNRDACNFSPASEPSAITVGATTNTDYRASFSNFGKCVDIFAPGAQIYSSTVTYNSTTKVVTNTFNSFNGTSMASPHVAGIVARLLQGSPNASPSTVVSTLKTAASANSKVLNAGRGSTTALLYWDPAN